MSEITITVDGSTDIEVDVETEDEEPKSFRPKTPQKVALGFSPGDTVVIGGLRQTIKNVDYHYPHDKETEFKIRTNEGLVLKGPKSYILEILEEW